MLEEATSLRITFTYLKGTNLCYLPNYPSIFYCKYFLLRPINFTNYSYSGECLNRGTSFSRTGLSLSLFLDLPRALRKLVVAGTVPINKLGGLQFRNVWVYSWKSSWLSLLTSICSNNYFKIDSSGNGSLAEVYSSRNILWNYSKFMYPVLGLFH